MSSDVALRAVEVAKMSRKASSALSSEAVRAQLPGTVVCAWATAGTATSPATTSSMAAARRSRSANEGKQGAAVSAEQRGPRDGRSRRARSARLMASAARRRRRGNGSRRTPSGGEVGNAFGRGAPVRARMVRRHASPRTRLGSLTYAADNTAQHRPTHHPASRHTIGRTNPAASQPLAEAPADSRS